MLRILKLNFPANNLYLHGFIQIKVRRQSGKISSDINVPNKQRCQWISSYRKKCICLIDRCMSNASGIQTAEGDKSLIYCNTCHPWKCWSLWKCESPSLVHNFTTATGSDSPMDRRYKLCLCLCEKNCVFYREICPIERFGPCNGYGLRKGNRRTVFEFRLIFLLFMAGRSYLGMPVY